MIAKEGGSFLVVEQDRARAHATDEASCEEYEAEKGIGLLQY